MGKNLGLDVLFWLIYLLLIVYIIGKIVGFVGASENVEILFLIILAAIIGIIYSGSKANSNIMDHRTIFLKKNLEKMSEGHKNLDKRISTLENHKLLKTWKK